VYTRGCSCVILAGLDSELFARRARQARTKGQLVLVKLSL
jgi:hypothetical protein